MRSHDLAIGTGATDGYPVSPMALGQRTLLAETVCGLTDRTDDIIHTGLAVVTILVMG